MWKFYGRRVHRKTRRPVYKVIKMYSDTDILAAVERGDITISDFNTDQLGPNSYDVRLGGLFLEVVWGNDGPWFVGPVVAAKGERVNVPVGGTLLAMTQNRIKTIGKVTAIMKAQSSTGRTGLTVCKCAGLGDIGYDNHWVMEISAFVRVGQPFVIVGQPIAQLAFFECQSEPMTPYDGQYQGEDWPLCMVPKKWRHRIIANITDIPGYQPRTAYVGGKIVAVSP